MTLKGVINLITFLLLALSIFLLIFSIKNKNKSRCQDNITISIIYIIYMYIVTYILPNTLKLEIGWGYILLWGIAFISGLILIIEIIINSIKLKKEMQKEEKSKKYNIIMILIPVIPLVIAFIYEICILMNCNMLLKYEYNIGIISSEKTLYAIGDNYCREISIGGDSLIKKYGDNEKDYYIYSIEYNEDGYKITNSNSDPELNEIDINVVENIAQDSITHCDYEEIDSNKYKFKAQLYKIEDTNYYIIINSITKKASSSGSIGLGEFVYEGDKYIGEIKASGGLDSVVLLSNK